MQVVIDIDDEYYSYLRRVVFTDRIFYRPVAIIAKGTPLPKGHGRLIDADEVLKSMDTWDKFGYTETGCFVREPDNTYVPYVHYEDMVKAVSNTQTIIEADGGDAE